MIRESKDLQLVVYANSELEGEMALWQSKNRQQAPGLEWQKQYIIINGWVYRKKGIVGLPG